MVENVVRLTDAISYKIYPRSTKSATIHSELKELNVHSIYPVGTKDKKIINGWLRYVKDIDIDFSTHLIIFMLNYEQLPTISPPIDEESERRLEEALKEP